MRKAVATFGSGPAAEVLDLSLPNFRDYAQRHGYEVVVGTGEAFGRPAAWGKVPLLQRLLRSYDFVLWLDSDTLFIDPTVDVEEIVAPEAFQAYVVADYRLGGSSPCTGVWALRAGDRAQRCLAEIWQQEDLIEHRWWEQAALMRLSGWTLDYPLTKVSDSEWDDGTYFLPEEWDMLECFGHSRGYIRHYTGRTTRRRTFEMRSDLAEMHGQAIRRWIGVVERHSRPVYRPITGRLRYGLGQYRQLIDRQLIGRRVRSDL